MGLRHGSELVHVGDEIPQVRIVRGLVQVIRAEPLLHLYLLGSYGKLEHFLLQKVQQEVGVGAGLATAVPSFDQAVVWVGKGNAIAHDSGRFSCWKLGAQDCHVALDWWSCFGPESVDEILASHLVRIQCFARKFDRQYMLIRLHCARLMDCDSK